MIGNDAPKDVYLGALLGAERSLGQRLSVYVPSRTKDDLPINQRLWMEKALRVLAELGGGGATAAMALEGVWIDRTQNTVLKDNPIIVYSFVDGDVLINNIDKLKSFLYSMGRENSQDAVAFEFDGNFFVIPSNVYSEEYA